jgi:hypothetical protein
VSKWCRRGKDDERLDCANGTHDGRYFYGIELHSATDIYTPLLLHDATCIYNLLRTCSHKPMPSCNLTKACQGLFLQLDRLLETRSCQRVWGAYLQPIQACLGGHASAKTLTVPSPASSISSFMFGLFQAFQSAPFRRPNIGGIRNLTKQKELGAFARLFVPIRGIGTHGFQVLRRLGRQGLAICGRLAKE